MLCDYSTKAELFHVLYCRIDISCTFMSHCFGTAHRDDIYLGWGLKPVPVHFWDLLFHWSGFISKPLPPWTTHMRRKLFRLLCSSVVVLTWVSDETLYTLLPPLPCLWDPVGDIFAPSLSGTIKIIKIINNKCWHHVNTARQYSVTFLIWADCICKTLPGSNIIILLMGSKAQENKTQNKAIKANM